MRNQPKAISLFSGAGGLDLGIESSGFNILCSIEIDEHCCATLKHNFEKRSKRTLVINDDIRKIVLTDLNDLLGIRVGELDLLFGGPPCQSFSAIGNKLGIADERGLLVFQMTRFAAAFKPKVVLMEQVLGFKSAKGPNGEKGGVKDLLIKEFNALGYETKLQTINAAEYGVPQLRRRIFLVANRMDTEFQFPVPTHSKEADYFANNRFTTVGEYIMDLSAPSPKGTVRVDSHIDVTPAGDIKRISYVGEGGHLAGSMAPKDIKGKLSKKDTTKYLKLHRDKQSNTLRCGEIFYHPIENRYLTPREYMRLHTFPDSYELKGPIRGRSGQVKNLDQHRQIANSVPPKVGEVLGKSIFSLITDT